MKYPLLQPDEYERLTPLFKDKITFLPHPEASVVAVAENDNGQLEGCLVLQPALHMEPLILISPHVRFDRLYSTIYNAISSSKGLQFYTFSDKEVVSRMAQHVGMVEQPMKIFMGKVE